MNLFRKLLGGGNELDASYLASVMYRSLSRSSALEQVNLLFPADRDRVRINLSTLVVAQLLLVLYVTENWTDKLPGASMSKFCNAASDKIKDLIRNESYPGMSLTEYFPYVSQYEEVMEILVNQGYSVDGIGAMDPDLPAHTVFSIMYASSARGFMLSVKDFGILRLDLTIGSIPRVAEYLAMHITTWVYAEDFMDLDELTKAKYVDLGAHIAGCVKTALNAVS